jgi:hypothetical protein
MAKTSGLNVRLYVQGRDLSGDANALSSVGYSNNLYDITTLDSAASKRLMGNADGTLSVNSYFEDTATTGSHAVFTSNSGKLPTADQNVVVALGSSAGDGFYGLVSKEADYNVNGTYGSALATTASFSTTGGIVPAFGEMLTAHVDTHASAGSGTVVDSGASSTNGGYGFLQVISVASGSVVVNLQESTSSGGSYSNFITFSTVATAGAPTAEVSAMTGTVQRYIKVTTTGTFSNAKIVVGFSRS